MVISTDATRVVCPASALAADRQFRVPRLEQLRSLPVGEALQRLRASMGGSYGYTLGYVENGRYHATRNLHRSNFVVVSDVPSVFSPGFQSRNHAGRGQNALFEDGHSAFLTRPQPDGHADNFFVNDTGLIAAGRHRDDSVVGHSAAVPLR